MYTFRMVFIIMILNKNAFLSFFPVFLPNLARQQINFDDRLGFQSFYPRILVKYSALYTHFKKTFFIYKTICSFFRQVSVIIVQLNEVLRKYKLCWSRSLELWKRKSENYMQWIFSNRYMLFRVNVLFLFLFFLCCCMLFFLKTPFLLIYFCNTPRTVKKQTIKIKVSCISRKIWCY